VIFTDDPLKRYEDFVETNFVRSDETLGIKYEKDVILEDTILLLRYNCPDRECDVACLGWPHLHRHVKQKHGKMMCDLCTRNKKVFTHEHELFTFGELRRHEKFGDDHPGAIDQSGFRGHPECGFCKERFYGDDELYQHCREKHERCHICDRRNPGSQVQYYLNYQTLEKHFEEAHFVCLDAECQANKTNVFESEMDLKAHQLSSHPNGLSKDARRDARLVNISNFDYRTPYQPQRRGEREHRGHGRGRDPNTEALPVSSAQPLRRDELAYQRHMAILNAQPQLVPQNLAASPVPTPIPRLTPSTAPVPNLETLSLENSSTIRPDHSQTTQEQARQIRHDSVLQRASTFLNADSTKMSTFRTHVSSYRSSTISATVLIDSFFSLFDVPSAELGKLVRELADIYEDETKRQDLLRAWNDWLSINADYPSLPGPSGILPGTDSGGAGESRPGGRRVLRLKSSTAQSSRSAVSRQGSWGNALGNSASSKQNPFPALGGASSLSNGQKRAAWTAAPSPAPARASPANSRPASRPPATMGAKANEEMFPALPMGRRPNTLVAGLTRGTVRWDDGRGGKAPTVNPWGSGANESSGGDSHRAAGVDMAEDGGDSVPTAGTAGGGGKKGKKAKQVLYKFG
jgi:E3 ubiquitin-protein ligase ZNF598